MPASQARIKGARGAQPGRFRSAREAVLLSPELMGGLIFPFLVGAHGGCSVAGLSRLACSCKSWRGVSRWERWWQQVAEWRFPVVKLPATRDLFLRDHTYREVFLERGRCLYQRREKAFKDRGRSPRRYVVGSLNTDAQTCPCPCVARPAVIR
jgi:hypothetical protein